MPRSARIGSASTIARFPGASVLAVDTVTGPYDVIAVVEAKDVNEVSEIVSSAVHSQEGVVRTTTCVTLG